jgi:hypothetical protein
MLFFFLPAFALLSEDIKKEVKRTQVLILVIESNLLPEVLSYLAGTIKISSFTT